MLGRTVVWLLLVVVLLLLAVVLLPLPAVRLLLDLLFHLVDYFVDESHLDFYFEYMIIFKLYKYNEGNREIEK